MHIKCLHYETEASDRVISVVHDVSILFPCGQKHWRTNQQHNLAYDADGSRVKTVTNGVTTVYIGSYYEWKTGGESTKYYRFGGQRVAMRKYTGSPTNTSVSWLHSDHLGSASLATDYAGGAVANSAQRYKPFGEVRVAGSGLPSKYTFTGQRRSSYGTISFPAREYSPLFGRFLSADTVVPQFDDPQSLNRFSYVRNSPLNFTDPSGHDPIDAAWETDFYETHRRRANDEDRRDYLFMLMFKGNGDGGAWTAGDWAKYQSNREEYWQGTREWNGEPISSGVGSFASHIETLASYYVKGEEGKFVGAIGLVWGGVPYSNRFSAAWDTRGGPVYTRLHESMANWRNEYVDGARPKDIQSHHWAGLFYMGFFQPSVVGYAANAYRESKNDPVNKADVALGNLAVDQGYMLFKGVVSMAEVGDMILYTLDARPSLWPVDSPGSRSRPR